MSKLGEMADTTTPKVSSLVPVSELESDSRIFSLKLINLVNFNNPSIFNHTLDDLFK